MKLTEPQIEHIEFERIPPAAPAMDESGLPVLDLELERGVRLRELPGLPKDLDALKGHTRSTEPDPLYGRYVLVDKKNDDRVVATFSVRRKLRPHAKGHMVLTNLNLDAKKLDVYGLTAGLLFLRERGPDTYGFFSCFAPGHRSSDFECVREPLPIWKHVAQVPWIPLKKGRVQMGGLKNWFFKAPCFSSDDPKALAKLMWKFIEQGRLDDHDLLLAYFGGWFQCIPVQRKAAKPMSFSILHPDEYGEFGGLDLCGLVSCVRTKAMVEALAREDTRARQCRFEAAYGEVSLYTIGTTPYMDLVS